MKSRTAAFSLALAAGVGATAARAEILSTWEFPANRAAWEEDAATDTNAVTVLSARRKLDGSGTFVLYRNAGETASARGGSTGTSGTFVEESVVPGFALLRSAAGGGKRGGVFTASDSAAPYVEDGRTDWGVGRLFGEGFGGWVGVGAVQEPTRSFRAGQGGETVFAASGEGAIGRTFEGGVALDSGTFSVTAEHGFTEKFSGFALYADAGLGDYRELIRVGLDTTADPESGGSVDVTGFVLALSAGGRPDYAFFGRPVDYGQPDLPLAVEYELAWRAFDGGLEFMVTARGDGFSCSPGEWLRLAGAASVSAVGVVTDGGSQSRYLLFDGLAVEGHVVPEPSVAALFFLGAAVLGLRRRAHYSRPT